MKIKTLLASVALLTSTAAYAQDIAKPKVQTSAKPGQTTVFEGKGGSKTQQPKGDAAPKTQSPQPKDEASAGRKRQPARRAVQSAGGTYHALKTNVAYDAFALLNLAYEFQVHDRLSVEIPLAWSLWDLEQEHGIRAVLLQPEARWWMGSEVGSGHFVGLHAHLAWFNVKWNETRYQDTGRPLVGVGLSYGYKLVLGDCWGVEFGLGLGYANMKYDTFYNIDNGARLDTRIRNYWGITRLGIALVYRF